MGWGCYKHEFDAGSEEWEARMGPLCDRKLAERPLTFGRDNQICPACYEELEAKLKEINTENDILRGAMPVRTLRHLVATKVIPWLPTIAQAGRMHLKDQVDE